MSAKMPEPGVLKRAEPRASAARRRSRGDASGGGLGPLVR